MSSVLITSAGCVTTVLAVVHLLQSWRRRRGHSTKHKQSHIDSLQQLKKITEDGRLTNELRLAIHTIHVSNQGRGLGHWHPSINHFERLTSLNLSGNAITYIPATVCALKQLQVLDVSSNALTSLPPEVCQLTSLRTLNMMKNRLTVLPAQFGKLQQLRLLGLKSNQLVELPDSFTQLCSLVELFITDNKLTCLPEGFGALTSLVKLQAAFNPFTHLPPSLFTLPRLEMLRVAVCSIQQWPAPGSLLTSSSSTSTSSNGSSRPLLPRLAWASLGGNPAAAPVPQPPATMPTIAISELQLGAPLGDGASGEVLLAGFKGSQVAVKFFHADVSPDGRTAEEVGISCQLDHPNLTRVLGLVAEPRGMVLGLVSGQPLAAKPTSAHLLRCKWPEGSRLPAEGVLKVCEGAAAALAFLHARGIAHGDVYAHNLLVDEATWHATLCDFGAAFCYDPAERFWEAMEVRAFGLMMADMVQRINTQPPHHEQQQQQQQEQQQQQQHGERAKQPGQQNGDTSHLVSDVLGKLVRSCLEDVPAARPSFADIHAQLMALTGKFSEARHHTVHASAASQA